MERNEVSIHEARVYRLLVSRKGQWLTTKEIAEGARVAERTARAKAHKLTELNVLDMAEVFPGHRYRLSGKADKRNVAYVKRLQQACEVFGI